MNRESSFFVSYAFMDGQNKGDKDNMGYYRTPFTEFYRLVI